MKEFNSHGERVSQKSKVVESIAEKKDLHFIEAKDYVILSGRWGETDPREGLAKTFNTWKEALNVALFYDWYYTRKDILSLNLTNRNK